MNNLKKLTPCQAIKKYCRYECCANDTISWKNCPRTKCPLYPYRIGKRPPTLPFSHYMSKTSQKQSSILKQADLKAKIPNSSIIEPTSQLNLVNPTPASFSSDAGDTQNKLMEVQK